MSLSHEGEACRGSGDGPTGRRGIQPARNARGDVRHPAADRRGVLQTRVFGLALGGLDALCDNGAGVGRVIQRMHLGWLPGVDVDGEPPVAYEGLWTDAGHERQ
jgi:hypothetical protein